MKLFAQSLAATDTDMKRDYNTGEQEDVIFFEGIEVEHTPAYKQYTQFVVGVQTVDNIRMWRTCGNEYVGHIYFGANMSFPNPDVNDAMTWSRWENMILPFLQQGLWCTLDLDVRAVEGLTEGSLTEQALFIPMISVKLPYITQLGYNASIKLDDKDFQATNPGVWCHAVHTLLDRNNFTSWDLYTKDQTL